MTSYKQNLVVAFVGCCGAVGAAFVPSLFNSNKSEYEYHLKAQIHDIDNFTNVRSMASKTASIVDVLKNEELFFNASSKIKLVAR